MNAASPLTPGPFLAVFLAAAFFFSPGDIGAEAFRAPAGLIGPEDAVLLASPSGEVLFSKHADKLLVPASIIKILTALTALHYLGPDYRFPTEFYLDKDANLKIKGYGDPLLVSEVVADIAGVLRKKGFEIGDIVLDDTYFQHPVQVPGVSRSLQPYDATNGALCVNFNTVSFKTNAQGVLVSAEPQTPLLPMVMERIKNSGLSRGRIFLGQGGRAHTRYAGHMFRHFLQKTGGKTSGAAVKLGVVDDTVDQRVLVFSSPFTLQQVIARLLAYSNNFMANQMLLAIGATVYGAPATLEKGVKAARMYAQTKLGLKKMRLVEGSGISRQNRISARQMMRVLEAFLPYHRLMRTAGGGFYKTGTLSGISTRAGYLKGQSGEMNRYVIMVNTPGKSTQGILEWLLTSCRW